MLTKCYRKPTMLQKKCISISHSYCYPCQLSINFKIYAIGYVMGSWVDRNVCFCTSVNAMGTSRPDLVLIIEGRVHGNCFLYHKVHMKWRSGEWCHTRCSRMLPITVRSTFLTDGPAMLQNILHQMALEL